MATAQLSGNAGVWGLHGATRFEHRRAPTRLRTLWSVTSGVLGALFAAELVLPEADPDEVRSLLVELGRLDASALPAERTVALEAFQADKGLPVNGVADGRTVSGLMRSVSEVRELRELGL